MTTEAAPPLTIRILEAIAEVEGVDSMDLDFYLHNYIDADSLVALERNSRGTWQISFTVDGHHVTVNSDRTITVDGQSFR